MASQRHRLPLRSGGHAWSDQRVALGISQKELAKMVGINQGTLSHIERGRMVPTGDEYARVTAVLRDAEQRQATAGSTAGENPGQP